MVPFDTRAGKFHIEASVQRIEKDFQKDTMPEVKAPEGYISVDRFAKTTRMDPIKVRRLLKTGFLSGKKISASQWHIPEAELFKIQGYRPPKQPRPQKISKALLEETLSVAEFSKQSGVAPAKIKSFLRTSFLKGLQDDDQTWRIRKGQISKFIKNR
ncbi:MAG: hypothetical protein HUN05_22330 [Desulfobacter sp.]|nr:MAG: hypothetical protein HUN05_22330 [Desulfobacter sp.]